jgi:hypothetical protein
MSLWMGCRNLNTQRHVKRKRINRRTPLLQLTKLAHPTVSLPSTSVPPATAATSSSSASSSDSASRNGPGSRTWELLRWLIPGRVGVPSFAWGEAAAAAAKGPGTDADAAAATALGEPLSTPLGKASPRVRRVAVTSAGTMSSGTSVKDVLRSSTTGEASRRGEEGEVWIWIGREAPNGLLPWSTRGSDGSARRITSNMENKRRRRTGVFGHEEAGVAVWCPAVNVPRPRVLVLGRPRRAVRG